MYPTEPLVRSLLGPHEQRLCGLFENAWRKLAALPGRAEIDFKRCRATLIHQFVMNGLRSEYQGSREVRLLPGHETIRVMFGRSLLVRLKKMNQRGYSRAIPTQSTLGFTNAQEMSLFTGLEVPPLYNVDMGYVLNELETKIDHILVAARFGEDVIWSYEADRGATGALATITPAPTHPSKSPATIIRLPVDRKGRKDDGRA